MSDFRSTKQLLDDISVGETDIKQFKITRRSELDSDLVQLKALSSEAQHWADKD
jgi:hypothetical protein